MRLLFDQVKGQNLRDFILDQDSALRKLSSEDQKRTLLKIFKQVVDGIRTIHRAGIIHSDIKHENVMIEEDGNEFVARVIDLGAGIQAGNFHAS